MENGTALVVDDRKARLAALVAQAEAEEAAADAALTPDEAEEAAVVQRIDAARARAAAAALVKRRMVLGQQVERLRKGANGAYVVEPFDMEDATPGAGMYALRSPGREPWKTFQDAVAAAGEDSSKVDRAYNNLAAACILWSDAPSDGDAWTAHREKYPALVVAIGDAAGRLGGAALRARKR